MEFTDDEFDDSDSDYELTLAMNESFTEYGCASEENKVVISDKFIRTYGSLSRYATRSVVNCLASKCSICIEPFKKEDRVAYAHVNKYHIYHLECLKKWLVVKFTCPDCRVGADELLREI